MQKLKTAWPKKFEFILALLLGAHTSACSPFGKVSLNATAGTSGTSYSWDLSSNSSFTLSDSNQLEFNGDAIRLKALDQTFDSAGEFSGSHSQTQFSGGELTIDTDPIRNHAASWTPRYSSIVAYYPFENLWVDSINGYDVSEAGAMGFSTTSKIETYSADMGGGIGTVANTADLNFGSVTDFSFSFWFKSSDTNGVFFSTSTGVAFFSIIFDAGRIRPRFRDGSSNLSDSYHGSGSEFNDDQWHHAVLSLDRDGDLNVYIDGAREGSSVDISGIGDIDTGNAWTFPASYIGLIDDFAIWRGVALSEEEAYSIYRRQSQTYLPDKSFSASWTPQHSTLRSYWKMEGNWRDSKGTNHGDVTGVGNDSQFDILSKVGSHSGKFDGDDDYVEVSLAQTDAIREETVALWVKSTGASMASTFGPGVFSIMGLTSNNSQLEVSAGSTAQSVLKCRSHLDTGSVTTSNYTIPQGEWFHAACVVTYSGGVLTLKSYFNGELFDTETLAGSTYEFASSAFRIGAQKLGSNRSYNGRVDDLGYWSTPLTGDEISLIYHRQRAHFSGTYESSVSDSGVSSSEWSLISWITQLPFGKELPVSDNERLEGYSNLVESDGSSGDSDLAVDLEAMWHFNESTGGTAPGGSDYKDATGNSNDFTVDVGSVSLAKGKLGNSAKSNSGIGGDVFNFSGNAVFTISAWFNTSISSNYFDVIRKRAIDGSGNQGWIIYVNGTTGQVQFSRTLDTTEVSVTSPASVGNDGKWHHAVMTYDGAIIKAYIDGRSLGQIADARALVATVSDLRFGDDTPDDGSVDEIAIWSRALDPEEISRLYQRGGNRVQTQIRICSAATCAGEPWLGPDGSAEKWFSEQHSCTGLDSAGLCDFNSNESLALVSPQLNFSDFSGVGSGLSVSTGRYFQYRLLLESDDPFSTPFLPSLASLTIDPAHYPSTSPSAKSVTGPTFSSLVSLSDSSSGGCQVTYQFSIDRTAWFYHDGSSWTLASAASQSNSAAAMTLVMSSFDGAVGSGTLYLKTFLNSDASQSCVLSQINATVKN